MTTELMPLLIDAPRRPRDDIRTALVVDLALAILESSGRVQAAQYLYASGVELRVALRVLNPLSRLRRPEHEPF